MSQYTLIHTVNGKTAKDFLKPKHLSEADGDEDLDDKPSEPGIDKDIGHLEAFVEKMMLAKPGHKRVILRMPLTSLKNLYLAGGDSGGKEFVNALDDITVKAIALAPQHPEKVTKNQLVADEFQVMPDGYSFKKLVTPQNKNHAATVLLDVPNTLIADLEKAGKASDVAAARAVLTKIMNHKYYVMSLNNARAAAIADDMDREAGNLGNQAYILNLNAVQNYPNSREFKEIRTEWNKLEDERAAYKAKKEKQFAKPAAQAHSKAPEEKPVETPPKAEKPADKPTAAASTETPQDEQLVGGNHDIEKTTERLTTAWENFVRALGEPGKNGKMPKAYGKLPFEQRAALQAQIKKMADLFKMDTEHLK